MKLDKRLVITLIVLAVIFLGYKLMNFYYPKESSHTIVVDMDAIKVINEINLPYVNIYLYSDGKAYLVPIDKDEISKLESGNNLKDRLTTLYNNSTTLDKKYDNRDIKGYNVNLDDLVEKIEKFLNGVKLKFNKENGVYRIYSKKTFLGLGVINNDILKRDVIIIDNF